MAINLLTDNQASIETDMTGLAARGPGVSVARVTTERFHGVASVKVTMPSGVQQDWGVVAPPGTTDLAISASTDYSFQAQVKGTATETSRVAILTRDSGGTIIAIYPATVVADGTFQLVTRSITSEANAAFVQVVAGSDTPDAVVYVDCLQIESSSTASDWRLPSEGSASISLSPSSSISFSPSASTSLSPSASQSPSASLSLSPSVSISLSSSLSPSPSWPGLSGTMEVT